VADLRIAPKINECAANLLSLPEQVLILMVKRRPREFAPFPRDNVRKMTSFDRSDGLKDGADLVRRQIPVS
jgi:hypothetical protein